MTVSNGARSSPFSLTFVRSVTVTGYVAEPGYYTDGRYGIRIENIVIVRDAQTPNNFGDKGYLRFEHVTLVRPPFLYPGHMSSLTA